MKNILWLLFIFIIPALRAQDFDRLMTRQFDCNDVSPTCALLFVKYLKENKTDSAGRLLNYWENKCGNREPVQRARIILALQTGAYHDSMLNRGILSVVINYQNRLRAGIENDGYTYDYYRPYYGYIPVNQEFDKFTAKTAKKLKLRYTEGSIERLFADFYSDEPDSIFARIQSVRYSNSRLYQEYYNEIDTWLNKPEFHISFTTGIWIPTGGISGFGPHPELGFQMGVKNKKLNYDLTICFKFGNTARPYYARRVKVNDTLVQTSHFLGGYIGLDFGYDVLVKHRHELQLQAGLGLDGFDVFDKDSYYYSDAASVMTYNFNFGAEHRFYFSGSFYLGLQVKYNIVDYSINQIVDFTGNPFTVRLIFGGFGNVAKAGRLETLKYRWRQ